MNYSESSTLTNVLIDFSKETGSDNSMGTIDYQYDLSKFTELVFSCLFFIFISNKMAYTSREEWDTNINSVGGKKDIHLVVSPWSQDPSANSTQGTLTSGVLVNEFEPPEIMIEPATEGYFYQDRMNMGRINKRANSINRPLPATDAPEKFRTKREPYVAPSRRTVKNSINPSRSKKENYNPGIPGLVGSNIHQENFTQEESSSILIIIILLSVIVFCIVGVCFGLVVPRIYVSLVNKSKHN